MGMRLKLIFVNLSMNFYENMTYQMHKPHTSLRMHGRTVQSAKRELLLEGGWSTPKKTKQESMTSVSKT